MGRAQAFAKGDVSFMGGGGFDLQRGVKNSHPLHTSKVLATENTIMDSMVPTKSNI